MPAPSAPPAFDSDLGPAVARAASMDSGSRWVVAARLRPLPDVAPSALRVDRELADASLAVSAIG